MQELHFCFDICFNFIVTKTHFMFVSSYKKPLMWNAVVGIHNLENTNESSREVSVCVYLFTSNFPPLYAILILYNSL